MIKQKIDACEYMHGLEYDCIRNLHPYQCIFCILYLYLYLNNIGTYVLYFLPNVNACVRMFLFSTSWLQALQVYQSHDHALRLYRLNLLVIYFYDLNFFFSESIIISQTFHSMY